MRRNNHPREYGFACQAGTLAKARNRLLMPASLGRRSSNASGLPTERRDSAHTHCGKEHYMGRGIPSGEIPRQYRTRSPPREQRGEHGSRCLPVDHSQS
jgi:hypothetical protein